MCGACQYMCEAEPHVTSKSSIDKAQSFNVIARHAASFGSQGAKYYSVDESGFKFGFSLSTVPLPAG